MGAAAKGLTKEGGNTRFLPYQTNFRKE